MVIVLNVIKRLNKIKIKKFILDFVIRMLLVIFVKIFLVKWFGLNLDVVSCGMIRK